MKSLKLCILYPTQYENLFVIVMLRYLYFYKRLAIKKKKKKAQLALLILLPCTARWLMKRCPTFSLLCIGTISRIP